MRRDSYDNSESRSNYKFPEVSEVWLGYSRRGNDGHGLGNKFARELKNNLSSILNSEEKLAKSSHLEKLCLVSKGVGIDNISDFTLNLIKSFLVDYTESFSSKYIDDKFLSTFKIKKSEFDYNIGIWLDNKTAKLPFIEVENKKKYVLLTPKNLLVRGDTFISKNDFLNRDQMILSSIDNPALRDKINSYFRSLIPSKINKKGKVVPNDSKKNRKLALLKTSIEFPEILDYYIKYKEDTGSDILNTNTHATKIIDEVFYSKAKEVISWLQSQTKFYDGLLSSLDETISKINIFKNYIEDRNGWKIFWNKDILRDIKEEDINILIDMIFNNSLFSVDNQVNNGRGPADMKISNGAHDSTIIEIKLAKNTKMKKNLQNQLDIYKKANHTQNGVYLICYFNNNEKINTENILKELNMTEYLDKKIFLIDCGIKESASKV